MIVACAHEIEEDGFVARLGQTAAYFVVARVDRVDQRACSCKKSKHHNRYQRSVHNSPAHVPPIFLHNGSEASMQWARMIGRPATGGQRMRQLPRRDRA